MNRCLALLLSLLLFLAANAQAAVDHVEPPSWWIGMHQPHLELMLHGRDRKSVV